MDPNFLDILACPHCYQRLELYSNQNGLELICQIDQLIYPIQDGIPVLLKKTARHLDSKEKNS
ncbi:Trm112 family protein [Candidatus Erwinia haradaeae]|uniref:UPF0434 protein ERCISPPA3004_549 n=1 Tax=Candidatus Erwinia haradaeae TaxID=1922217 RepID=A0A451DNS8_9GAMM|nr:Trm112 family protein [Candidatus Erwinia haradaeae]VFP88437.1 UPF0434 protein YcaR [Candidatus Erwinia haradaeae]